MRLVLVRHGRPVVDQGRPAHEWDLDPDGLGDIWALRDSDRLPRDAAWFSSPEPKATQTARHLTEADVSVIDDLRELGRDEEWADEYVGTVRRAFECPGRPARSGWEPLAVCRQRTTTAVRRILDDHRGRDVVLAGHGIAWTALTAALTGKDPDLRRWQDLGMPDVIEVALS